MRGVVGQDGVELSIGHGHFINAQLRADVLRKEHPRVGMVSLAPSCESAQMMFVLLVKLFDRDLLDLAMAASEGASVSAVFFEQSGELVFKLGAWKDKRDVAFEILLLPNELPVPAPKREACGSAAVREVGHRDRVKLSGHDLLMFVFVGEWGHIFFLTRDGSRVPITCPFGEVKPLKDALGENECENLLGEFHTMSIAYDGETDLQCTAYF